MKTCKPVAIFNVVDLFATALKIIITRKEAFGLNVIQENHTVNAVLSQDSKLRRKKKHRQKSLFNVQFKFKCTTRTRSEQLRNISDLRSEASRYIAADTKQFDIAIFHSN